MPITLAATAVPPPQVPGTEFWIADNSVNVAPPSIPQAQSIGQGASGAGSLPSDWNQNACRMDLLARHGGGAMGLLYGLVLTAGTGLVANVSAGHVLIDGIVEVYAATTIVVSASQTNWIWLKTDGTLEARTALTAPATSAVLLGAAVTDGSGVTSIETAGVVYIKNGVPERSTADTGKPADTPNASWRGWTKATSGNWWWNGTEYQRLVDDIAFNKDAIASGESVYIPLNYQASYFDSLEVSGSGILEVAGKLEVRA